MRTRYRVVTLVALMALLVSIMPAVAGAAPPVAVKIGLAAPLSEGAVALGQGMSRGTHLAVSDYSARLAAAGVTATVVDKDDEGDPAVAQTVAGEIVADNAILGVVGHLNSGCSIPAAQEYNTANLAMISPASTNPLLTQLGLNNVFRTCATDSGQGVYAANIVERNLRLTTAYVVDDSTPYGTGVASKFSSRFKTAGGKVVGSAHTSDRDTDFYALIKRIKAKNPKVVFYGGIYNAGGIFVRQLKAKLPKVQVIGVDGLYDPYFINLASKSKAEGTLATSVGLPTDQMVGGAAFKQRFALAYPGIAVGAYDTYAYDAAAAILEAIIKVADNGGASQLAGAGARELVRAQVAASSFVGVTGHVGFNGAGDTTNPTFSVYRVKSGSWRECAQVGKPSVPASIHKNVAFKVTGSLNPHHTAGSKAVTLRFWRKVGSKWVLGKTVAARVADAGSFSTYSASVKLTPKGTWRVVATHGDGLHGSMDSVVNIFKVK